MNIQRSLLLAAAALAATTTLAASAAADDDLYHWFHPVGAACPSYGYDPGNANSITAAIKACTEENNSVCVAGQGTASPAC